jgi:iron complex transport system substrate-binding protein
VLLITGVIRAGEIKRIVSLAPSLTQNLHYLESEDRLVGCTSYCQTNNVIEVVASAVKVNIEKVDSLKPDLVIATTLTENETVEILRKFDINVKVYPECKSFNDICSQFVDLGKILGKEDHALNIIKKCREKVDKLQKSVNSTEKPKVFMQIGANPLYTVLPDTFMDDYITFAGGQNIASGFTIGNITRENVLLRNPDVIFIVTMDIVGEDEKKNWEKVKEMNASKNEKIFIIDSNKACNPTPVTFVETLDIIINLTYGK